MFLPSTPSTPAMPASLDRRAFLGLAAGGVAAAALATHAPSASGAPLRQDVFTLGVASGDPAPDSVVLWTRLAVDPVAPDGLGGMPDRRVPVRWEIAEDPSFARVVRRGTEVASAAWAHSVHAEVTRLQPDREYWYRFRTRREISPVGRTRTAPAADADLDSLTFAYTSCQSYIAGYYTAYEHMANEDLDLIVHLGDYIYENDNASPIDRPHLPMSETYSLADYRIRYGQYKSDLALQAAHAAAPWITVPDDHEVENNYTSLVSQPDREPDQDPQVFAQRRAAAYQANYENLPLRRASRPAGPDMQFYRRLRFGRLAEFSMLDGRQYRSPEIASCAGDCPERWAPDRPYLGAAQEQWLFDGLARSTTTWNVIGNQQVTFDADTREGSGEQYATANWMGYAAARQELYESMRGVDNVVVITGDAHKNAGADLHLDFQDPDSPIVAAELLGTSISTGGDGEEINERGRIWLAENPHIKFTNNQRGYQRVRLSPGSFEVDFRTVPYVSRPGAPLVDRATVTVEAGRPGIAEVSG